MAILAVAIAALILVAGCSKKAPAPAAKPAAAPIATPAAQPAAPAATPQTPPAAQQAPATPPELTQADQAVQDIGTSDLDQVDKDINTLVVP